MSQQLMWKLAHEQALHPIFVIRLDKEDLGCEASQETLASILETFSHVPRH